MKPPLSHVPLLPVFAAFTVGIVAGIGGVGLWWAVVAAVLVLGCRWLAGDLAVIALASLAAGVVAGAMGVPSQLSGDYALQRLCWQGKVVDVAETEGARRLTVDIDRVSGCSSGDRSACVKLRASLIVPSLFPIVDAGDRVVAQLVLEPIADMRDLPDEIDYGDYMRRNGISAHGVVSPDDIAVVSKAGGIAGLAGRIRRNIISLIASSSVDDRTGALISALLVGDRDMLPDATRAAYSAAGLAHILAVSGLHVGIIAAIAVFILWPMRLTRCNRLRILMAISIVWCYAIISGMSPSAVRAALMASVFLGAGLFGRNSSSLNSLCLAGLIILACDPMSVKSIGFQLSFAAVAAIILLVPVINRVDRREHPVVWHIASAVTVPVAAMVGSGAIAAYYFHSFPVYFLAANIASAFMAGPLIFGGIVLVACESVGYDPLWLCRVLDLMYSWITGVASEVGAWPGSSVAGIYFRPWLLIPYFAVVAMIGMSLWRRRLFYLVGGVMIATAAWLITTIIPYGDDVQREWYIARRTYRTDIVMRDAHRAYLITTAPRHQIASVAEECRMRYAGYIGMRGIDSLEVVDDSFVGQGEEISGRLVMFGNKVMIIVTSADDMRMEPMRHVDYAVVCRGFTGDVTDAGNILHADTVILSKDLHARRHDRYMEELRACGIPVVSLRDGSFRRVLSR